MNLRKEAEDRAKSKESTAQSQSRPASLVKKKSLKIESDLLEVSQKNDTPKVAHLAEADYKLNGGRARASSGEFVNPRWTPDGETSHCKICNSEFDLINRKHHCRHCGFIFCQNCSSRKAMLPMEFGYRDPERVCDNCWYFLQPYQQFLCINIANHQRANSIDIASSGCTVRRHFNLPLTTTLGSEIRKAAYSTYNLFNLDCINDKRIPLNLLASAKGIAFITVVKAGFVFAPRVGTGLVIARLPNGHWSAPSAIGMMGLSWGAVIGVDVTDHVVILNSDEAVKAFSGNVQLVLGAGLEIAVGLFGRSGAADVHIGDTGFGTTISYSHSKGVFAGATLDGSVIVCRSDVNQKFYGRSVSPSDLLTGVIPPPRAAASLYDMLSDAIAATPDVKHSLPSPLPPRRYKSILLDEHGIDENDYTDPFNAYSTEMNFIGGNSGVSQERQNLTQGRRHAYGATENRPVSFNGRTSTQSYFSTANEESGEELSLVVRKKERRVKSASFYSALPNIHQELSSNSRPSMSSNVVDRELETVTTTKSSFDLDV